MQESRSQAWPFVKPSALTRQVREGHIQGTWAPKQVRTDEKCREQKSQIEGCLRKNGRLRDCREQFTNYSRLRSGRDARPRMPATRSLPSWSCQPRARTGRKPGTLTSTRATTKPAPTSIAAVEFRPGIDMVRRRSTVRFRNGAPKPQVRALFRSRNGPWCRLGAAPKCSSRSHGPNWSPSFLSASRVAADPASVQSSVVTAILPCRRICMAMRGWRSNAEHIICGP